MITKKQILNWLDNQSWKNEFYENYCKYGAEVLHYDNGFILNAFIFKDTPQGYDVWGKRNKEYIKWYESNERPKSWEEYCERKAGVDKYYITEFCDIRKVHSNYKLGLSDANIMSEELCKAFIAYMKLMNLILDRTRFCCE